MNRPRGLIAQSQRCGLHSGIACRLFSTKWGSEHRWRQMFHGNLIRLLTADQRLSVRLDRTSGSFPTADFVWASVGATLEALGGFVAGWQ